jgi:hypothetical protein
MAKKAANRELINTGTDKRLCDAMSRGSSSSRMMSGRSSQVDPTNDACNLAPQESMHALPGTANHRRAYSPEMRSIFRVAVVTLLVLLGSMAWRVAAHTQLTKSASGIAQVVSHRISTRVPHRLERVWVRVSERIPKRLARLGERLAAD